MASLIGDFPLLVHQSLVDAGGKHEGSTPAPPQVVIDLEFDDAERAEAYLAALRRQFYSSQDASPAVGGGPRTRIAELAEAKEY